MSLLKGIFGGGKKGNAQPAAERISVAPIQSQDEQDATRLKMQAELDAARASREARKAASESNPQ
ncbi:MAG: hypothetical protein AB7P33_09155 [Dehalococcoidia bacterium]